MFTADLLERAAKTAVQAFLVTFLGALTASVTPGVAFNAAWWQSAGLAALAAGATAAVSAVMSLLSKPVGNPNNASILASGVVAPPHGPVQ